MWTECTDNSTCSNTVSGQVASLLCCLLFQVVENELFLSFLRYFTRCYYFNFFIHIIITPLNSRKCRVLHISVSSGDIKVKVKVYRITGNIINR